MRAKLALVLLIVGIVSGVYTAQDDDDEAETDITERTTWTTDSQRYDALATLGNPEMGAALFDTFQQDAGFACSTCHMTNSEGTLIGPGLLNISIRAETRNPDQSAAHYIFDSIINPDNHIVEGFTDDLMPENWAEIYSVWEISHIVAYLFTLTGEEEVAAEADAVDTEILTADLPEGSDATTGEALFNTFQPDAGFACATCHMVDSENTLIGPGLLNVGSRAGTRVEGQDALTYMFTSITEPDAHVVEGFSADLMPENWVEIYSETEIYHIITYLLTLEE